MLFYSQGSYKCISWKYLNSHNRKTVISSCSYHDYWFNGMQEDYKPLFPWKCIKNSINLKKRYEKKQGKTGIEIQSQHWDDNRQSSMESISVEYFPSSIYLGRNEKNEFYSFISDDNEQYACDSHDHMFHLLK